jgi:hypothetical protein
MWAPAICLRLLQEAKMMDPHAPNTFFVSPRFGELSPGENLKLRVTFCPKGRYDYKMDLPIYLTDSPDRCASPSSNQCA